MPEYPNPIFEHLLRSDLPVTWTVVQTGWEKYNFLTRGQLQDYAMEQLSLQRAEQFDIMLELASSDPTDTWTLRRCLEQLASGQANDLHQAQRIWRWVLFNDLIRQLEEQVSDAIETPSIDTNEYYSFAEYLWDNFHEIEDQLPDLENRPPIEVSDELLEVRDILRKRRVWLEQERQGIEGRPETGFDA